jgi:myosin heavy subunit
VRYVITGASMRTYLLEKSRVVYQSEGERNYHIFYQMCASRKHHAELGELFLEDADKFNYLGGSRAALAERNIDDSACFRETFEAMNLLGFGIDDRRMFFKVSELYSFCSEIGFKCFRKQSRSSQGSSSSETSNSFETRPPTTQPFRYMLYHSSSGFIFCSHGNLFCF